MSMTSKTVVATTAARAQEKAAEYLRQFRLFGEIHTAVYQGPQQFSVRVLIWR